MRTPSPHGATLRGLDQIAHLDAPERKQGYVNTMFDIIAPAYDTFTTLFSFGMDKIWKNELVGLIKPHVRLDADLLDLACGTGDLAYALARLAPRGRMLGIDASPGMIAMANRGMAERMAAITCAVRFEVGDMCSLQLPDVSQDLVSVGYGLRNVPKLDDAISEIARVLRPHGLCACLDFSLPEPGWWRVIFLRYLQVMGNVYGLAMHGEADVYGYIARSIERFVGWRELSRRFEAHGLTVLEARPKLNDGVCLHLVRKKP